METKKFTTVNNWVCKEFIKQLCAGNFRACAFMIHNLFECLDTPIREKMFKYFYEYITLSKLAYLYKMLPHDVQSTMCFYSIKYIPYDITANL